MIPEAARHLKRHCSFEDGQFYMNGTRIPVMYRYAAWWFEVECRGCLYQVPASLFAWYWHTGEYPIYPVRHRNGNKLDFARENLRLVGKGIAPTVKMIKRVSGGPLPYTGVLRRTVKPDG